MITISLKKMVDYMNLLGKSIIHLNLSHSPEITHVTTGEEAIEIASSSRNFDLIISTMHIEDMHVIEFAKKVHEQKIEFPLFFLLTIIKNVKPLLMIQIFTYLNESLFGKVIINF